MLLDTGIFIDYLRGDARAAEAVLLARADGTVLMHAIVAAELLAGVLNRSELRRTSAMISTCRLVPPDETDFYRALALFQNSVLAHGVDWNDCLIACTAVRLRVPIAALNRKHFREFRGLKILTPY